MAPGGFIHDKLDIKFLVLYLMARAAGPLTLTELLEMTSFDPGVNYFDLCEALSDLVRTEHLTLDGEGRYDITDKGRENGAVCESSLACSVRYHADRALSKVNAALRRDAQVRASLIPRTGGNYTLKLVLEDEYDAVMTLELIVTDRKEAEKMARRFKADAETLFHRVVAFLLEE
ncbi:MAG: DUF4364 family protein [Oscillospiraceae bacterium]|nr:DUF4364 family protein [Oscillospiraceae bacterium]